MDMDKQFEIVDDQPVYQGFFTLSKLRLRHSLFRGGWSGELTRELFQRGACVAVVPYDPQRDALVLVEQFRVGALPFKADPWLLEIVAGAVEAGESAEQVARREALEEAGCTLRELIQIGRFFTTPGAFAEQITLFCGLADVSQVAGVHGLAEEGEDIRVHVVSFDEAWALLQNGVIDSAIPMIALQWLALNRERWR